MARASTRSQRPSRASGASQAASQGASQNTRANRTQRPSRVDSDDDGEGDEDEDEAAEGGDDMDVDQDNRDNDAAADITRKANQLVRLALFNEHRRMPLRRDEISKKVLGNSSRLFARVFDRAQIILNRTFGMELVELPSRAALAGTGPGQTQTQGGEDDLEQARKATGLKKKAASSGSKTYMVRSTLSSTIIEHASLPDEAILTAELDDAEANDNDNDDNDTRTEGSDEYSPPPRYTGAILSFSQSDHPAPLGILYVVLSLILVSGRTLPDNELRSLLKRLHLPERARGCVPFNSIAPPSTFGSSAKEGGGSGGGGGGGGKMSVEAYLTLLMRQGYIDRIAVGGGADGATKKGGKGKRARTATANADEADANQYEWRWGARAQSEIGEKGVAKFVAEFMVGRDSAGGGGEDEGAGVGGRRRRQEALNAKVEKMEEGIQKAAGGNLNDLMP